MTMETKRKVKKDAFMAFRDGGVAMMNSLKLPWKASDGIETRRISRAYAGSSAGTLGGEGEKITQKPG